MWEMGLGMDEICDDAKLEVHKSDEYLHFHNISYYFHVVYMLTNLDTT